ncbi:hypothetical protein MIND_00568500 [Mycena indigotica]|uniref:DUF5648 domain-containing protein n=1 Tax=Mycena indigotica TaxID=2126181 RepID=A0A8H6SRI6_9AGAR|nr:uncharacterized protein MIND_00568500 [Mycena indigotica]KAF7303401.1 hypothetical protein MIND_00568500 [Mycena indigotica]
MLPLTAAPVAMVSGLQMVSRLLSLCALSAVSSGSMSVDAQSQTPLPPDCPACATGIVPLHRVYNPTTGDHAYTSEFPLFRIDAGPDVPRRVNATEAVAMPGYVLEGSAAGVFLVQQPNTYPLLRLWAEGLDDHFYTIFESQARTAMRNGYVMQGNAGYVFDFPACQTTGIPLYELYLARTHDHFYTTSAAERASAIKYGYQDLKIAAYVPVAGVVAENPWC